MVIKSFYRCMFAFWIVTLHNIKVIPCVSVVSYVNVLSLNCIGVQYKTSLHTDKLSFQVLLKEVTLVTRNQMHPLHLRGSEQGSPCNHYFCSLGINSEEASVRISKYE